MTVTRCIVFLMALELSLCNQVECQGLKGLPPATSLENLAVQYRDSFTLPGGGGQQRLFPALNFTFRGRIIGWKVAATEFNDGNGRPILSVWSTSDGDTYTRKQSKFLEECILSMVRLENKAIVFIHSDGPPSPGINFDRGDILGLFMRQEIAEFVPYLYDGSSQSAVNPKNGTFSYILRETIPRSNSIRLSERSERNRDRLLPLMSLELCSLEDSTTTNGIPACDNTTQQGSCNITTTMLPPISTAVSVGPPNTTGAPMLLAVVIALPVALFFLLALTLVILVVACCLFARKRKHSMYTTDIALREDFRNGSTPAVDNYKLSSTAEYDNIDPAFIISITDENRTQIEGVQQEEASAGNYEEPVISHSYTSSTGGIGEVSNHMYDTPLHSRQNSASQVTPRCLTPLPPTPNELSPPLFLPEANKVVYHTLERRNTPPLAAKNTPLSSPAGSPHQMRLRLRSTISDTLALKRTGSGAVPNNVKSPVPDWCFRLESGIYVPTQEQRDHLAVKSLFDDTSYATFNRIPNSPSSNNWAFFDECETYWKPASDSRTLYNQFSSQKYREILRKQIEIKDHLGSGEFGTVCRGKWHTDQGDLDIAVKMLHSQSSERDMIRFLQEAAIVGQFKHPNIVRLHGVVTVGQPVMIVLELVQNGDLRKYLKSLRPVPGELVAHNLPQRLLDFCSQIALGMEYLSRKEFVHRDVAARNILVTEDFICKIADFGMSRDLDDDDYYISNGGKIPIKWTAPEAIHFRKYSSATDVWSFGVLMYEIWSLGRTPFKDKSPDQTISLIDSGHRLSPPPGCPKAIYRIMIQCWNPDSYHRPSFTKLLHTLSQPTNALLHWSPDDSNIHQQANQLGSNLEAGRGLYSDLQKSYLYSSADLSQSSTEG